MMLRHSLAIRGVVVVLSLLLLTAVACDDEEGGGRSRTGASTSLDVTLDEFSVEPLIDSVTAGEVTFNVSNVGTTRHRFLVIRSDLSPGGLPLEQGGSAVDEERVGVIGKIDGLDAGTSEELTLELEAGDFVLICNVPDHYMSGMFALFEVQ